MKYERLQIIKSIIIVLILTLSTIMVCVKLVYRNYIYTIRYYEKENLYTIRISDNYKVKIDITVICDEDKCKGDYKSPISVNVDIDKTIIDQIIKEFNIKKNIILDINEKTLTEDQKELINKIIG